MKFDLYSKQVLALAKEHKDLLKAQNEPEIEKQKMAGFLTHSIDTLISELIQKRREDSRSKMKEWKLIIVSLVECRKNVDFLTRHSEVFQSEKEIDEEYESIRKQIWNLLAC